MRLESNYFEVGDTARAELLGSCKEERSLCRYKLQPEYRLQLRRAILEGYTKELQADTPTAKRRARFRAEEARMELEHLISGGKPSAFRGYIALRPFIRPL